MAKRPALHHGSTQHTIHIPTVHQQLPFQQVHILPNRKHHIQTQINHGVPQGSSLSPTPFIIYAANLPKPPPTVHISQFADDIKTFSSSKNISQLQTKLQKSLNRIAAFCGKSRISLNENKITEMIITGRVHKYTKEYIPPLQIHNKPIPTTKHA